MNTFHAVDVALHIEIRNQGIFCYQHVEVGDMTKLNMSNFIPR